MYMTTKSLGRFAWGLGAVVAVMAAFLMITSCNSETIVDEGGKKRVALQVKAEIKENSTRSVSSQLHETAFLRGEQIGVLVGAYKSGGMNYMDGGQLVYTFTDDAGNLSTETPFYFTSEDASAGLRVRGIYPSTVLPAQFNTAFTFSVQSNQSSDANYNASDLMFATGSDNVTEASPTVTLSFEHRLSKIVLDLKAAGLEDAIVSLTGVALTANLGGAFGGAVYSSASGAAEEIILKEATNTSTKVCGIIPPQSISADAPFFKVVVGGETYTACLPAEMTSFESGYAYTFNINMDRHVISVTTASISAWKSGGDAFDIDVQ